MCVWGVCEVCMSFPISIFIDYPQIHPTSSSYMYRVNVKTVSKFYDGISVRAYGSDGVIFVLFHIFLFRPPPTPSVIV